VANTSISDFCKRTRIGKMENLNTSFKRIKVSLGISELLMLFLWLGIIYLTWYFMRGADHFLQLTQAAMGKYFPFKYVLILHITAGVVH
jgi:hypothetical protein